MLFSPKICIKFIAGIVAVISKANRIMFGLLKKKKRLCTDTGQLAEVRCVGAHPLSGSLSSGDGE